MAYKVIYTNSFRKSLRQCHKRGYDINLAKYVDALKYPCGDAIEHGESDGYACAGTLA